MVLVDKGYFDYDFEKTEMPEPVIDWEDTVMDEEETENLVAMFGIGRKKKPETLEEIQEHIIKQIKED